VRYHFTPTRLAKIKKKTITSVVRSWRNRNLHIVLVDVPRGAATFENSLAVSQKVMHRATT